MFEGQRSQPEDSGDTFIQIRVEDPSGSYQEHGADVSKPLKDLVNDPSDYLDRICKRLDMPITGVGNYKKVAKYYNFDMYTIYYFEESPGGPSEALISAITAKYPEVTVSMFARAVAKQTSRWDVVDLLMDFDRK